MKCVSIDVRPRYC